MKGHVMLLGARSKGTTLPRGLGGGPPAAHLPYRFLTKVQNWSEFGQTYEN